MTPLDLTWVWPDTAITIGVVIVVAVVVHLVVVTGINRVTRRMRRLAAQPDGGTLVRRAATAISSATGVKPGRSLVHVTALAHLLKSVWTFVLVIVVILTIMSTLGMPLTPLLTSAGIGGVVLAFGAQSLIKDYLSGIAMIVEDQYGVGDQIKVGDIVGTVEDITLRVTRVRDASDVVWYVRNGEILRVGNVSQGLLGGRHP